MTKKAPSIPVFMFPLYDWALYDLKCERLHPQHIPNSRRNLSRLSCLGLRQEEECFTGTGNLSWHLLASTKPSSYVFAHKTKSFVFAPWTLFQAAASALKIAHNFEIRAHVSMQNT